MEIFYLIIALFATTIGAMSGLGGGVIIKPVLDAVAPYDAATIGILSSFTVLAMAIVSTIKQFSAGIRFEGKRTAIIVVGSIGGGIAGKAVFSSISGPITAIQSAILALLLILVLAYLLKKNIQSFHIHNPVAILVAGFLLGLAASFLGVGGGPFNVVLLALLFSMDSKAAAVHSILIILFSQSSKLLTIGLTGGFGVYDLTALYFMIPGGIAGGFLGAFLNRKLKSRSIEILFRIVVSSLILLNLYNLINALV